MTHDRSIGEMRSQDNKTLLQLAAALNKTSCMRVLLMFVPQLLNAGDVTTTPLMLAVFNDHIDATKMLLEAGAVVKAYKRKYHPLTVFDIARNDKMKGLLYKHACKWNMLILLKL